MRDTVSARLWTFVQSVRRWLSRVEVLVLFPALALAAFWLGANAVILATSFLLPGLLALQALRPRPAACADHAAADGKTGLPMRPAFLKALGQMLDATAHSGQNTACLVVELDDVADLSARWGAEASDHILCRSAERLQTAVRQDDLVACIGEGRFAVALSPVPRVNLDVLTGLVDRIQNALAEPIALAGVSTHQTASVGFAIPEQTAEATAACLLDAALTALIEARRHGPAGVRGFSERIKTRSERRHCLAEEVETALSTGAIRPWFQPQISAHTGEITGVEALARWHHPTQGVLVPPDFLPALQDTGNMGRLGDVMLRAALAALTAWDAVGCSVPSVSINVSDEELRDPGLADRIKWEVDRCDLPPARLTVEILETVAAQSEDDVILRNIEQLAAHGFNLDLDDFGTGQSSIANIRRFRVHRIKIDRGFVSHLDSDPAQRAIVSGILALADRLGVGTVAEGVETEAEQGMLAHLGCDHLQGYFISRPMPGDQVTDWLTTYRKRRALPTRIGRRAG
ncbi:putative bifunctional diguanylate cyclase/phosphodiesterase [Nioella nitratireducens]|uniref:putative bifunctional diguanylate cyclase/phosphodiesterase n=1 Tax=Nioella nitratireducens TaxID=1287720 RepID=UPI0008FD4F91|nr:bifunctional diguanylate cyclase/phosphodiesterase [Nioella nitratireducens]